MFTMYKRNVPYLTGLLALLTCSLVVVAPSSASNGVSQTSNQMSPAATLSYKSPQGWVAEHPASSMRAAQYKLPKAEGDTEDASLVLYYFGQGQGGTTQANIDRWISQMKQTDGKSPKEGAKLGSLTVNGLKVTTVDVSGTYSAETSPGSGTFTNNPGYRLRAAVVETPKGSYFAKLIGPEKTVARWDQTFDDYIKSFEFK